MTQDIRDDQPDPRILYADIIALPHWQSDKHPHMSETERAAQFSSFAALVGYEDMVAEEAREVDRKLTPDETETELLNQKLTSIAEQIAEGEKPLATITYFQPDARKNGGRYLDVTDRVRRVDSIERKIELCRKTGLSGRYMTIDMDKVIHITEEPESESAYLKSPFS